MRIYGRGTDTKRPNDLTTIARNAIDNRAALRSGNFTTAARIAYAVCLRVSRNNVPNDTRPDIILANQPETFTSPFI